MQTFPNVQNHVPSLAWRTHHFPACVFSARIVPALSGLGSDVCILHSMLVVSLQAQCGSSVEKVPGIIKSTSLVPPALAGELFTTAPPGRPSSSLTVAFSLRDFGGSFGCPGSDGKASVRSAASGLSNRVSPGPGDSSCAARGTCVVQGTRRREKNGSGFLKKQPHIFEKTTCIWILAQP